MLNQNTVWPSGKSYSKLLQEKEPTHILIPKVSGHHVPTALLSFIFSTPAAGYSQF